MPVGNSEDVPSPANTSCRKKIILILLGVHKTHVVTGIHLLKTSFFIAGMWEIFLV